MKLKYAPKFKDNFCQFPENIKRTFYQKVAYLLKDLRYPSLHAKKYDEAKGIWQARVNRDIRFYFLIQDDVYVLLDIKHHPK
ncbi:MAG: hypothetical protein Q8N55_03070 [bacterium]|nr:hypothetical protein [bacterium]